MIRSFGWQDLPTLYRYRHQGVFLNSALLATRGADLIPGMLSAGLHPATGLITWVCKEDCDDQPLIGQTLHTGSLPSARISFLAPKEGLDSPSIQKLLEQLAYQAGQRGAFHLLAEIETNSSIYEALRRAGFASYIRQRIWQWDRISKRPARQNGWKKAHLGDLPRLQSLYRQVAPEFISQIEPLTSGTFLPCLVYSDGSKLISFAEIRYGGHGIWVKPTIQPDLENVDQLLADLIQDIPDRRSRPLYFCVRAYQARLEPALEDMGGIPSPEQTVMVKHMAAQQKVRETFKLPNLERQPETPLAHTHRNAYSSGEHISHASAKNH
ncbi:MAG: hypothetical protein FJ010_03275 [Chloroflexi bacterium]|nr:hypothetical protein [Chloroflexota bacterium]